MKKFTCIYRGVDGLPVTKSPKAEITAETVEDAATMFAWKHPTNHPTITVQSGLIGQKHLPNPRPLSQVEEETRKQKSGRKGEG